MVANKNTISTISIVGMALIFKDKTKFWLLKAIHEIIWVMMIKTGSATRQPAKIQVLVLLSEPGASNRKADINAPKPEGIRPIKKMTLTIITFVFIVEVCFKGD